MANLAARMPNRPSVVTATPTPPPAPSTSGGEFELRGMGDKLSGQPYIAVQDADESGKARTLYVSPATPAKDIYADASPSYVGDFSASRRRLMDSADTYIQGLQGKTADVAGIGATPAAQGYEPLIKDVGGRSPRVDPGEDYSDESNRRFNSGETSAKGSTAMRGNKVVHYVTDAKQRKNSLERYASKIESILSDMRKKAP